MHIEVNVSKYLAVYTLKYKALNTFIFNNYMLIEVFDQAFKKILPKGNH